MIKLIPGLSIRLYFQRNSTVFTVFGHTILIERAISTTSSIIAGKSPVSHPSSIHTTGKSISKAGTTKASIIKKVNN